MNFVYLLPFSYFFNTRLRGGSVAFHFVFEWLATAVLVCLVGSAAPASALVQALVVYAAFISLYEIGYLINDLFASRKEQGGRLRGPQGAGPAWVAAWFVARLAVFAIVTGLMDRFASPEWWSFFSAMCAVFALHNVLEDREFKSATFLWLAWFRFMAPVMFVVQDDQRMGIGFAAAMAYAAFRLFGYLDSKGMLSMPGRQRPGFRLFFFMLPLAGGLALWPYDGARGFIVLTAYFALAALLGTLAGAVQASYRSRTKGEA